TAISERLKTRATIPATIDAACERLRPVMLTTLTTVMGLAPLLFETSRQAEILKPMVLTLVSGLSLGFFLVLLVVPALIVVQRDIALALKSARRMPRVLKGRPA
ncbi:MAG: efflux RND transporter permease subunit, partial [Pseudomonadota bacterium]